MTCPFMPVPPQSLKMKLILKELPGGAFSLTTERGLGDSVSSTVGKLEVQESLCGMFQEKVPSLNRLVTLIVVR